MGCNLRVLRAPSKVPFLNLNWNSLNLGWTQISYQKTSPWREVQAWIWTDLLAEHSYEQECVYCGDSSALPVHTKQSRGIIPLTRHRWHIQNLCEDSSDCAVWWTASGWSSHPCGCVWLSAWSSNAAISRCRGAPHEAFLLQHTIFNGCCCCPGLGKVLLQQKLEIMECFMPKGNGEWEPQWVESGVSSQR